MNELEFSKKSWHYKLASVFSSYDVPTDICAYIRTVFLGAVILLFVGAILLVAAIVSSMIIGDFVGWIAAIITGHFVPPGKGATLFMVISSSFVAIGYREIRIGITRRFNLVSDTTFESAKHSSFISNAYRSIKEKTCIKINFS